MATECFGCDTLNKYSLLSIKMATEVENVLSLALADPQDTEDEDVSDFLSVKLHYYVLLVSDETNFTSQQII